MQYLSKEERREAILQAAMRVALAEGLAAMTVRRIAAEAGVATGQVHHHFASGGELKSLAFVRVIRELLDADVVGENASWRERLHSMLGSDDAGLSLTFASGGKLKFSPAGILKSTRLTP